MPEAAAGAPGRWHRGPWHPATHLALLHAAPAFTVIGVGLACGLVASRGLPSPERLALLALLLAGNQYAAGALNDAVDAPADAAAGRPKPIPAGAISRRATAALAVAAGAASLAAAAALGPVTLALAAVGLACAWAYDLRLKGTAWSWLPFAVALPLVPLFGYAAAGRLPPVLWWVWPIGALLAVTVHLADALPDVESDRATGSLGLATHLGVRHSLTLAAAAFALALALTLASGLLAGDPTLVTAGAGAAALLAAAAFTTARGTPDQRRLAYRLLLVAIVTLALGWSLGIRP